MERSTSAAFRGFFSKWPEMKWQQNPFLSFVDEQLDYYSTSIPRKHPHNERVISAEELGTMFISNLRGITTGIRPIWRDSLFYFILSCYHIYIQHGIGDWYFSIQIQKVSLLHITLVVDMLWFSVFLDSKFSSAFLCRCNYLLFRR